MARIRSVHPALFTDEAWVSCSPLARILYVGLWTDADDQGVFEWKPLQIKMRLLPGDEGDAKALLAELVGVDLVASFEHGGRVFGAIKNFRKFQRPKAPNAIHPCPDQWRRYVGLGEKEAEPLPNHFPNASEISPQMEDGGGREEETPNPLSGALPHADAFAEVCRAYPADGLGSPAKREEAWREQIDAGAEPAEILYAVRAFAAMGAAIPSNGRTLALHRFLRERRWENYRQARSAVPVAAWAGPASLRAAVMRQMGEAWTVGWLDRWTRFQDVPERLLMAATPLARDRIEREIGALLREHGVSLRLAEEAA